MSQQKPRRPAKPSPKPTTSPKPEPEEATTGSPSASPAEAAADSGDDSLPEEARAALRNVTDGEGDDTPPPADVPNVEAEQPPQRNVEDYREQAAFLIDMGLDFVGGNVGIAYSPDTRQRGADKLAPVLAKHGGAMPAWLEPYKEEFALGMWCAGVAWKTYQNIQEAQAREAEQKKAADNDDGENRAAA